MSALMTGVHSLQIVNKNHENLEIQKGEEMILVCTADVQALACVFRGPKSQSYSMIKGAKYDNDRVQQYALDEKDCGMKISSVEEDDNGEWECSVTGKGAASGNLEEGKGFINVVVALPPSQLYLEQDGNPLTGPVDLNLDSQRQSFIDCVAVGGRPSPSFNWYIGDQKMNANIEPSEETDENGVILYKSQLEYNADPKHNAQNLRCEVIHMGYTTQQLSDSQNIVSAPLNLQFKPEAKKPQVFYGLKEDHQETVRILFKANPRPTEGKWMIGDVAVPVGGTEADFTSTDFTAGDVEGDYIVELVFNMGKELENTNGVPYKLEVTNSLGSADYGFQLALSTKPPAESAGGPVIGIVVLVVIIILIAGITLFLRAKSLACFAVKPTKDEDVERAVDKEGSDTESAEDTTAAKDEAKPSEEEAKKEDKKSSAPTVVARMTNLFAAVKKSVKKPKENKYTAETPESEMKLHENEEKKEGDDSVVYADLDKSALGSGNRDRPNVDSESTEYAEIRPQN